MISTVANFSTPSGYEDRWPDVIKSNAISNLMPGYAFRGYYYVTAKVQFFLLTQDYIVHINSGYTISLICEDLTDFEGFGTA